MNIPALKKGIATATLQTIIIMSLPGSGVGGEGVVPVQETTYMYIAVSTQSIMILQCQ